MGTRARTWPPTYDDDEDDDVRTHANNCRLMRTRPPPHLHHFLTNPSSPHSHCAPATLLALDVWRWTPYIGIPALTEAAYVYSQLPFRRIRAGRAIGGEEG